jgi:hypothetical protein
MAVFEVRLSDTVNDPTFAIRYRDLPQSLDDWLQKQHRGSCVGHVTDTLVILEICAPSLDSFRELIDTYVEGGKRHGRHLRAIITQKDGPTITPTQADLARSLTPQHAKLTKRFLMSLPAGVFVASNVFGGPGLTPSFAEAVGDSTEARTEQWKRAVAAGAGQRSCHVFPNEARFCEWLQYIDLLRQAPPPQNQSP